MRAVVARRPGGVEVLEIVELPAPEPGPGQILVRNFAAALNRADILQRRGLYPPPPGESEALGLEFAGEVAACGDGVTGFQRGDRVFGLTGGGACADYLIADQRLAISIPDNLSYDAAAAVPEAFITAGESLFTLAQLAAGEHLLVHAGASGVGSAAIQLAGLRGAVVLATAGTAAKAELCARLGAARVILYRQEDFAEAVRQATGGEGVHAILDLVGARHWERNLASLREGGALLIVGLVGGARVEADLGLILRHRLRLIGTALRGRTLEDKAAITRRFVEGVLPEIAGGRLHPVIDSVYPLEEVRAAHERMEANLNAGKIVLRL